MPRVKWLLFPILLLLAAPLSHAIAPTNHCAANRSQQNAGGDDLQCDMANTVSGRGIVILVRVLATTYTVSATETLTCPAGLVQTDNVSGFVHNSFICYLLSSASNHADFQVKVTVTSVSGGGRASVLDAFEIPSLGSFDIGAHAQATTVNVTTTVTNDILLSTGSDITTVVTPAGSNTQLDLADPSPTSGDYKEIIMFQQAGATAAYTANFTEGAATLPQVVVAAFTGTGGVPTGVYSPQECTFPENAGSGTQQCILNGPLATNDIVVVGYSNQGNNGADTCTFSPIETCVCPAGSVVHQLYSSYNMDNGICYAIMTSAHSSGGTLSLIPGVTVSHYTSYLGAAYKGLLGVDSGSASSCAAITCTLTTAAGNEFVFIYASDVVVTSPHIVGLMTPGNSFDPDTNIYSDVLNALYQEGMAASKTIPNASAGNTFSYSIGASAMPMISGLAFGPSASAKTTPFIF